MIIIFRATIAISRLQYSCLNQTTKTSYTEVCEDDDIKQHGLQRISQCSNCEQNNAIYYCIEEHEGRE